MVFDRFCIRNTILPITEDTVIKGADIYEDLSRRGELIGDTDILVAATALANRLGIVTNNEDHFRRIRDLHVENWLK